MLSKDQKSAMRDAVIEFLAMRSSTSHRVSTIFKDVSKSVDFQVEDFDIAESLAVLCGLGLVREVKPWGQAVKEYQITDDGARLRYERQQQ